jgi:hypothetical protein
LHQVQQPSGEEAVHDPITVKVDGVSYTDDVEPRLLLVHYLHEVAGKTGTRSASAADGTSPPSDLNARPDYRQQLARVLTGRALAHAAGL